MVDRWFIVTRWLLVRILVYLTAASATTYGLWKLLGQKEEEFAPGNWRFWVAIGVAVIPALATLVVYSIPDWRARRRRKRLAAWSVQPAPAGERPYFQLGPRGAEDKSTFSRFDNAHGEALAWLRGCTAPLLYLTGVSGSGKSSILAAHVVPAILADTLVVKLRGPANPMGHLREVLLAEWSDAQAKKHADDDILVLVCAAAEHLRRNNRRLLLVCDQFEELLVLHTATASQPNPGGSPSPPTPTSAVAKPEPVETPMKECEPSTPTPTPTEAATASEPAPVSPVKGAESILDLFRSIADGQCGSCRALLSLRIESTGDLTRVRLPAAHIGHNQFDVRAFDETPAREFLKGGFSQLGAERLDQVIAEAVALDNLAGRVRPITLNMVGLMLHRLPTPTSTLKVGHRPFTEHINRVLQENDIRDHASGILRALIDDRNNRLARTVGELAGAVGDPHVIDGCLGRLALPDRGLVRCLNPGESDVGSRRWEVSHDFVAKVLELVFSGLRPGLWQRVRPWLAPAAFVLWAATFFVALPYERKPQPNTRPSERDSIISELSTKFGIRITRTEADGSFAVRLDPTHELTSLSDAARLLGRLGTITSLDASGHHHLKDLSGCNTLSDLRSLNLTQCISLANVDGLKGLTSLRSLDLSYCGSLTSVDVIRELTSLRSLDLNECKSLTSVDVLKGLTSLQSLDLSKCYDLTSVDGLKELTSLQTLGLSGCEVLTSVEGLKGLTSLEHLYLRGCRALKNVDGLKGLTSLRTLDLSNSRALTSVDGLKGMTSLRKLNLHGCSQLSRVQIDALQQSLSKACEVRTP